MAHHFDKIHNFSTPTKNLYGENSRHIVFWTRMWIYNQLFNWHFGLGNDFKFLSPGVEVKFACEEAEKVGAELHFLGPEMDGKTW